jgi:hypothetical protein
MDVKEFDLDHIFTYHAPGNEDIERYQKIRDSAKEFARTVIENCPSSADKTVAIRRIREAVMIANAAIALDGRLFIE